MGDEIERFVDLPDGGCLYYQTQGQGQDVVLLNAGTRTGSAGSSRWAALSASSQTLARRLPRSARTSGAR